MRVRLKQVCRKGKKEEETSVNLKNLRLTIALALPRLVSCRYLCNKIRYTIRGLKLPYGILYQIPG